jgi:hypothetical protein
MRRSLRQLFQFEDDSHRVLGDNCGACAATVTCHEVIVTAVGFEDYFSNTGDSFFSDSFSSISDSCYREPPLYE